MAGRFTGTTERELCFSQEAKATQNCVSSSRALRPGSHRGAVAGYSHEFGHAQLAHAEVAIPAWLICDRRFLWKCGWGKVKPFSRSDVQDIASGYPKRADRATSLARMIDIPETAFVETVSEFNSQAARGGNVWQRSLGGAGQNTGPCIAPIEAPLRAHGLPLLGWFACSNHMALVMEGAYPGLTITLGPALSFGGSAGPTAAGAII
ncbi:MULTISPECIES: hypothetical protein [unclassified Bradyrhizobium]|uniref:hypothetical protein n=2 Tax=unclassified Bradyrhizobium TaxID=2631580 RepID=UPI0028EE2141|nr:MULTISPECIES: hypothetical protein [unclassified Bradyrhizobium]